VVILAQNPADASSLRLSVAFCRFLGVFLFKRFSSVYGLPVNGIGYGLNFTLLKLIVNTNYRLVGVERSSTNDAIT
jgi:hypothetical protein